tara:strand:- start:10737 stop:11567 length:831 start_codon:yes stop_codon:yes gene_type:complete
MNILVTGGAGFIGSNLVDKLVRDHKVTVWDNYSTGDKKNLNELANCVRQDITKPYKPLDVDIIFHLAALARIQPSFDNPDTTHDTNVTGTIRMLELARKVGAKFVYAGSSSFYHDVHANPYTFTKWLGEQYCELYNKVYGVKTVIARFFNVYGPRQLSEGAYATVIGVFEKQHREGTPLTITGTGEKRRDFTHVDDIVNGLIAMSKKDWDNEIFNLGTGKNYSINELASMFECETTYIPDRPGEAQTTLADISKSETILDWHPTVDLEGYVNEIRI